VDLLIRQFRKQGERENPSAYILRDRQGGGSGKTTGIGRLQVNRNRIVDGGLDSLFRKMRHQAVSNGLIGAADDILVVHVGGPGGWGGQNEFRNSAERFMVRASDPDSALVGLFQVSQLHAKNRRLQLIQPGVPPCNVADAVFVPPILTEGVQSIKKGRVTGRNGSSIPETSQVLGRVEAERRGMPP
jgi:hypothetical protein